MTAICNEKKLHFFQKEAIELANLSVSNGAYTVHGQLFIIYK